MAVANVDNKTLEKRYRANEVLKPIIDKVGADIPFSHSEFVKRVYERVITEAQEFPGFEKVLTRTRFAYGSSISSLRLEEIQTWTNTERTKTKNGQDIYAVFERVAEGLPVAQGFLNTLKRQNLTAIERAHQICDWMDQNRETLATVRELDLSNLGLTFLIQGIDRFQGLRALYLCKNQLTVVPRQLGDLINLKVLNLSSNRLAALPAELGGLRSLEVLDLSDNQLIEVSVGLLNLRSLKKLFLNNNRLTVIPRTIGRRSNLGNLEILSLHFNQLTSVPKELEMLTKLVELHLSNNLFTEIPEAVRRLKARIVTSIAI